MLNMGDRHTVCLFCEKLMSSALIIYSLSGIYIKLQFKKFNFQKGGILSFNNKTR